MKSWKTTLAGAVTALGMYLQNVPEPEWLGTVGKVFVAVGTFLVGFWARDNKVSSEAAGAK